MCKALWVALALVAWCDFPASAQTTFSNQDDTLTGWNACTGTACAGGTCNAASFPHTIGNAAPSLDGASSQFSYTAPSCAGDTNVLWYDKVGANNSATYFTGIYNVYQTSLTGLTANEFDQFKFDGGTRYMMGSQCLNGGVWQIWNQNGGTWANASPAVSCSLPINTWHQIIWVTHADPTSSTACSGHPCMHYDALSVDGTVYGPFQNLPAGTSGDPDNVGFQVQGDVTSTHSFDMFGDIFSLTTWNSVPTGTCAGFATGVCPANIPAGVTGFYFIDYVSGADANDGTCEIGAVGCTGAHGPWQHAPGMANAVGVPAAHTPGPGEGWIFKGGVTIDSNAYPMNVPWGGTSGHPDYMGYDPGWFTGGSWARPIFNGGGSTGYDTAAQSMITDVANHASYVIVDNPEFTGIYFGGACTNGGQASCGALSQYAYNGADVQWEVKNAYVHGWSHCTFGGACIDPGNEASFIYVKQDTGSSIHDTVIDGFDSPKDCCNAAAAWNEYKLYISFVDNAVFGEINFFHDSVITNMVPPSGAIHGNAIHVFGSSNINELIYNNVIFGLNTGSGDENCLIEETGGATVYFFNNVMVQDYHGTGCEIKNANTNYIFQNTIEAGVDPVPTSTAIKLYATGAATVTAENNVTITNNSSQNTVCTENSLGNACLNGLTGFTGTFTAAPVLSTTCSGGAQNTFGGVQICAPIGSGNGTGNLNLTQTYAFAPLDPPAAAIVGNASGLQALCSLLTAIGTPGAIAAGTACLSDTSYGVAYNSGTHTVSYPARAPVAHPLSGLWQNGAYQFLSGSSTCGAQRFCAYTGSALVPWPAVPNLGGVLKNGAIVTDTSYPSGTPGSISRCTDQAIDPNPAFGNQSKSAGLGGSGDAEQLFNTNSTMLHFNASGGKGYLTDFNPSTLVCGDPVTGYAVTADKNLSNPGSSSVAYNFGGGTFDWTNPLMWYSFSSGSDATGVTVAQYAFNSFGQFTVNAPYMDFQYGLPLGSLISAWQGSHSYASGQYVSYALNSTQAPDWAASHAYAAGDIIQPLTNNPLNCGFKASTGGVSSSSSSFEPTWSTSGSCVFSSNGQISEGVGGGSTVKWRNLGGPPVFTFQLVSAGGTSGASTPFGSITHPDLLATYSDNGLTWENVGPKVPAEWTSFAGISSNSNRFCSAFSSNTYGNAARGYNTDNGGQGSGLYVGCYDFSINTFVLLNTATGFQSTVTCAGGTGSNCAGGTATMTPAGSVTAITGACPFPIHNLKGGSTLAYTVITWQGTFSGSCSAQNMFSWQPFATFNSTTTLQLFDGVSNHWTIGNRHVVNVGDASVVGGTSGTYDVLFDAANPSVGNVTTWQISSCGGPNPPCDFGLFYDSHMAYWHNAMDDDLGPICGTVYNVATLAPPPLYPWQGEEVCVTTTPSWVSGVGPIGNWTAWRFAHNFNTGGNPDFDVQFAISQLSTDGNFLAFSSDWNCTLGTISGTTSPLYCGPPWVGGTAYTTGQMVNPFSSTGGSGTNYGVYQITTPGTSASTTPSWFVCNSGTAGSTVTDLNGVVYTCLGAGNGKGEVFIVNLSSLQPPPRQLNSVQPPMPSGTNHAHYATVLGLNNVRLTGQTVLCGGGNSASSVCFFDTADTTSNTGLCTPGLNFATMDSIVAAYTLTNMLLTGVTEGGTNSWTPKCVYSQAWANASYLPYLQNQPYLPGDYILQGGNYWQLQVGCYPGSGYDNTCITGSTAASFAGAGPVTDGTVVWVKLGANAPMQDVFVGTNYKGGPIGSDCFTANGSVAAVFNLGSIPSACNTTQLYQSEVITSELPYRNWFINYIIPQVIAHYNGMANFGYVRVGCTAGGECDPLGIGGGLYPFYGSTAGQQRAQYLSYVKILDIAIQAAGPTMVMLHDTNCAASNDCLYADVEAYLAYSLNFNGISNNALDVDDVENMMGTGPNNCAYPLTAASGCTTGDWAYLCSTYKTNAAGQPFWCGLQTATQSTPSDCAQGLTGPLFTLAAGNPNCTAGYIGDLPFLVMLRSLGVGSPNVKIYVNNLELYVNPPASGSPPTVGAGDVLLALDPSYLTSSGAQASYAPYQATQAAAFFNWLFPFNPPVDRSFVADMVSVSASTSTARIADCDELVGVGGRIYTLRQLGYCSPNWSFKP